MGNALEKNKGGKGVRVGKFVVLIRVFRAGLAETFMVAAGGGDLLTGFETRKVHLFSRLEQWTLNLDSLKARIVSDTFLLVL